MASHTVALVPGDGIGPETSAAMQRVVEASGADIVWGCGRGAHLVEEHGTAACFYHRGGQTGTRLPSGPVATPVGTGFRSVNVALRRELGLYACLRPCCPFRGRAAATTAWISSSSARTPKTCTRASSSKRARRTQADRAVRGRGRGRYPSRFRHLRQADLEGGVRTDRAFRVRLRAQARTPQGDRRAQGEHHEAYRRLVCAQRARLPQGAPKMRRSKSASSTRSA